MNFIIKNFKKSLKLKKGILIQGLPGIGNVGRIAVDYLIDQLKAKKYMEIYSYSFPNVVFVNEDSTIDLPKIEFWYCKNKRNLLLLTGDVQPVNEEGSYLLIDKIFNLISKVGIKEVISLGGIGMMHEIPHPKVFGAATSTKLIKKFKKHGVTFAGNNKVNVIIGAAGLLLGLAKEKKIDGISLLSETFAHPKHIGIKASKAILEVLSKYLKIRISLKQLSDEISRIEKREIIIPKKPKKQKTLGYIG